MEDKEFDKFAHIKPPQKHEPLWTGPNGTGENGGVTQGLINRFLADRERFYISVIEGLRPTETFNHRLEFGSMWHVCEESLAKQPSGNKWQENLRLYCHDLCKKYPTQQNEIDKWFRVCRVQFPIYVDYWKKHPDVVNREPVLQEFKFDEQYQLETGQTVRLRGKFDSVDIIDGGIFLQENKTKGDIDQESLHLQLSSGFDLQTMFYLTALSQMISYEAIGSGLTPVDAKILHLSQYPIKGVRYNVVRRPLSGGKGSIRQHQSSKANPAGESLGEFYERLGGLIVGASGGEWGVGNHENYFFMRWKIHLADVDIMKFKNNCLEKILIDMCDWYDNVTDIDDRFRLYNHFRMPYGIYSPISEGKMGDVDNYLNTGDTTGLERTEVLYPELPPTK